MQLRGAGKEMWHGLGYLEAIAYLSTYPGSDLCVCTWGTIYGYGCLSLTNILYAFESKLKLMQLAPTGVQIGK